MIPNKCYINTTCIKLDLVSSACQEWDWNQTKRYRGRHVYMVGHQTDKVGIVWWLSFQSASCCNANPVYYVIFRDHKTWIACPVSLFMLPVIYVLIYSFTISWPEPDSCVCLYVQTIKTQKIKKLYIGSKVDDFNVVILTVCLSSFLGQAIYLSYFLIPSQFW